MDLMSTKALGGVAIFGIVAALWNKIKEVWYRLYSLVIINMKVDGPAGYAMSMYILHNFKRSRVGDKEYTGYNEYVRPERRNQLIALKRISSKQMWWWKGRRPISVARSWDSITLKFIRGLYKPDALVESAVAFFNNDMFETDKSGRFFVQRKQGSVGVKPMLEFLKRGSGAPQGAGVEAAEGGNEQAVYTADKYTSEPIGWKFEDIGQPIVKNAIEVLSLTPEIEDIVDDIRRWYSSEEWFKTHTVPWKFGAAFEGMPGTGKTAVVRALGQELGMPVFIFDLATMTNQDLVEAWNAIMDWAPCIVLIEDIHSVFDNTINIVKTGQEASLSFDCLLNVLDGVENTEGVLTIITTNDKDKLSDALVRPGRANRVVHFGLLDEPGRIKMAKRILDEFPDEIDDMVNKNPNTTGAKFQQLCAERASYLWNEAKKAEA